MRDVEEWGSEVVRDLEEWESKIVRDLDGSGPYRPHRSFIQYAVFPQDFPKFPQDFPNI